ncbi:MAG: hypothetical protein HFF18_02150 [Oscillospiraceae bacterium]|nr:hypothetical protein [Oscillospiraceae bacterium]
MTRQMKSSLVQLLFGLVLLAAGVYLMIAQAGSQPDGFLLLGVGCGVAGASLSTLIGAVRKRRNPELARQERIGETDERNQMLLWRSKARAFDGMLYIWGGLLLWFALKNLGTQVVLPLTAGYLLIVAICLFSLARFQKEM